MFSDQMRSLEHVTEFVLYGKSYACNTDKKEVWRASIWIPLKDLILWRTLKIK